MGGTHYTNEKAMGKRYRMLFSHFLSFRHYRSKSWLPHLLLELCSDCYYFNNEVLSVKKLPLQPSESCTQVTKFTGRDRERHLTAGKEKNEKCWTRAIIALGTLTAVLSAKWWLQRSVEWQRSSLWEWQLLSPTILSECPVRLYDLGCCCCRCRFHALVFIKA